MKFIIQTILAIALLIFSISLHSQTNGTNGKVEPKIIMPPDSIAIISLKDIDNYLTALRKISHEDYIKLTPDQVIQDMYRWMILEWNRKKKK